MNVSFLPAKANLLPAPLMNRVIKFKIDPPTEDSWAKWMTSHYGNDWDKRIYVFLKRFHSEHYILKLPSETETLNAFPTPRSWSDLALLMKAGLTSQDIINGLVGEEVGLKLRGFLETKVDVKDLLKEPRKWYELNIDGKYMCALMLSSYINQHYKEVNTILPLLEVMMRDSRDFIVVTCMGVSENKLARFLQILSKIKPDIVEMLGEVVERKRRVEVK